MFCRMNLIVLGVCLFQFSVYAQSSQKVREYKTSKFNVDTVVANAATIFLKDTVRMGLSVGVYDQGKQYIYHFGRQDKNGKIPVNKSKYEIGSINKTMTGTILANAVLEGKLKLEDDIRKYLDGAYPNLEYKGEPIRLFQLLNHSSGLPFLMAADTLVGRVYSKDEFFKALHEVKLDTVPGIKLSYSNSAANLLSFILEKVHRQSYDRLLAKYLFTPLKMKQTGVQLSSSLLGNVLKGFDQHKKVMHANQSGAAGGVRSTIPDMLRYIGNEVDERDPVVALTHQPTWGQIQYFAMGLNWQMMHKSGTERVIFQSGGTAGFSSCMIFYPELRKGIILLSNESDRTVQDKMSEMAYHVLGVIKQ